MGLSEPYEILELQDGETLSTHILAFEQGELTIKPAHAPGGKTIMAIRLTVPTTEKTHFPYYWDATSKTLTAQLLPLLPEIIKLQRLVKITKRGVAPAARFTVEVV